MFTLYFVFVVLNHKRATELHGNQSILINLTLRGNTFSVALTCSFNSLADMTSSVLVILLREEWGNVTKKASLLRPIPLAAFHNMSVIRNYKNGVVTYGYRIEQ